MQIESKYIPFMKREEGEIVADYIRNSIQSVGSGCFNVLEWGGGDSTIYYVKLLEEENINFEWHVMEHSPAWQDWILRNIGNSSLHVHLFDYKKYSRDETRKICMREYVEFPRTLGIKFNLIIIDGRKRVRCLEESKFMLAENCSVYMDNAEREYYQKGISSFPKGEFITKELWRGSIK